MISKMEVIVFENNSVYDHAKVTDDDAVELFIDMCKDYVSPEDISQESTSLYNGGTFVTYADNTGCDKAMMVMIFGCQPDIFPKIKKGLQQMYDDYHNRT